MRFPPCCPALTNPNTSTLGSPINQELGLTCAEDLFDLEVFNEDPTPFYKFAKALYFPLGNDKRVEPSDSHKFLALLEKNKQLLRVYTQNIDGLEEIAGVSPKRMVYAHGSLQIATCTKCRRKVKASELESFILSGDVAVCTGPSKSKRKVSSPDAKKQKQNGEDGTMCGGVMKPGVTFFGETLGDKVRRSIEADREKADALIVIGTSLSVAPMSKVIQFLPRNIPRVLINRTIVHPPNNATGDDSDDEEDIEFREGYTFDAYMLGFCDDVTRALVKEMNGAGDGREEGKLLAGLTKRDKIYTKADWENSRMPWERVFLFPGAVSPDDGDELEYKEVAHCDGCKKEIKGVIHKCIECFDYDLCRKCYPKLSEEHHNGEHKFATEKAQKEMS